MGVNLVPPRPASPCIGLCAMDAARGLCTGCARTLDEIAAWGSLDTAARDRIWSELPIRAADLGLKVRRLPWRGAALLAEVERRFVDAAGSFVVGVHGAVAEVLRAPGEDVEVERNELVLTMRTRRAALRIEASPYLTAFELNRRERAPLIALAVPAGRAGPPGPEVLTLIGRDAAALLPRDAGGMRFDLGLGRRVARFTIRCADALAEQMVPICGTPWPEGLYRIGAALLAESPVRVVEAPCVRAEVDAPIPPPGGVSPEGPHTHLLPDLVARGFDAPPTLPLPKGFVASALFYPA